MPIKILHILDSLKVGGLENGVINLINKLDRRKFMHTICCIRTAGPMATRLERQDVKIVSMNNIAQDYAMPFRLMRVLKHIKPDIVHTRNWGTVDGIIAAKMIGIKRIIHGEHGREFVDQCGSNFKRNLIRKFLLRRTCCVVAVSEELKNWLIESIGIPEKRVVKIINGVDTEKFSPPINKSQAKRRLGISSDFLVVGTVGRLDPVKNYEMLLKAICFVKETVPYKVVFVGDGPERPKLEEFVRVNHLPNIVFYGEKHNVSDYLRTFDLFVLPSLTEGISNTILEAMACGVPVLATRVGGNPELVENHVTGELFTSGDHVTLSKRIEVFLSNKEKRDKFGKAARTRCERHFSLDKMVQKYDRLYSDLGVGQKSF